MILEQYKVNTEEVGFASSFQSTLKTENLGFILDALSKSFYSDIYGSVIREYASNSYDAEIEANVESPVVKLRFDQSDRSMHFIDHGTGLTPQAMQEVFISFGESTKRDSNKYIGSMGLGCKSLFAYCDCFYITTCIDGTEYQYMYSKTGLIPELDLIAEQPTTKCNGTDVWFYLKPSKSSYEDTELIQFIRAINQQLKYFSNVFVEGINAIDNNYVLYKGNHYICRPDLVNVNSYLEVCHGKNKYPIDFNILNITPIKSNIALYFEIGELDITRNRENLLYTDKTKQKIVDKIKLVTEELQKLYTATASETDDLFYYLTNRSEPAKIKFGEHYVNISDFGIKNKLSFTPTKDLNLFIPTESFYHNLFVEFNLENNKSQHRWGSFDKLVKKPSQFWYTATKTTLKKNVYLRQTYRYAYQGNVVWTGEVDLTNYSLIKNFYLKSQLDFQYDSATKEWVEINPTNIDYVKELRLLFSEVKKAISNQCAYYDSIVLPRKPATPRKIKENEEITVQINAGKRVFMQLDWLARQAATIYLCETQEEVYTLTEILSDYVQLKAKKHYRYVSAVIIVPKKYKKKVQALPNVKLYQEFFESSHYKRMVRNAKTHELYEAAKIDKDVLSKFKPSLYRIWIKYNKHYLYTINALQKVIEQYPVEVYPTAIDQLIVNASKKYKSLFDQYENVKTYLYSISHSTANDLLLKIHILQKQLAKCQK